MLAPFNECKKIGSKDSYQATKQFNPLFLYFGIIKTKFVFLREISLSEPLFKELFNNMALTNVNNYRFLILAISIASLIPNCGKILDNFIFNFNLVTTLLYVSSGGSDDQTAPGVCSSASTSPCSLRVAFVLAETGDTIFLVDSVNNLNLLSTNQSITISAAGPSGIIFKME